jgi:hypothetical protein
MSLHWMGQFLPSQTRSHTSFPIDSICSKQKNWTPSIPFRFRLRLTHISGHDSWTWLDLQTRTWPKVQWRYPSHYLGRRRSTYGPSWTLAGRCTPARIDEAFATILEPPSTLRQAEKSFEEKSPSMLAANYHAKNLDDMIPTHLNRAQRWALWHILKKHSILFSGKLGKSPCKPVHLELTNPNAKPYHGKP